MAFQTRTKPPFFLVWNPATGYTRKRHKTADLAAVESERLAKENPNTTYHVLMPIGKCRVRGG